MFSAGTASTRSHVTKQKEAIWWHLTIIISVCVREQLLHHHRIHSIFFLVYNEQILQTCSKVNFQSLLCNKKHFCCFEILFSTYIYLYKMQQYSIIIYFAHTLEVLFYVLSSFIHFFKRCKRSSTWGVKKYKRIGNKMNEIRTKVFELTRSWLMWGTISLYSGGKGSKTNKKLILSHIWKTLTTQP